MENTITTSTPNNLSTLSILHIVKGILTLAGSLFFIGYAIIMSLVFHNINDGELNDLPFNIGNLIFVIFFIFFIISLTCGILNLLAAKYMNNHKNYTFIMVVSGINCISGVLGIVLGVFTFIELGKPQVKELFGKI